MTLAPFLIGLMCPYPLFCTAAMFPVPLHSPEDYFYLERKNCHRLGQSIGPFCPFLSAEGQLHLRVKSCPVMASRKARFRQGPRLGLSRQGCGSLQAMCTARFARAIMLSMWELGHLSIWLQFWKIWQLKSWDQLGTPPVMTRNLVLPLPPPAGSQQG